ncbi:hypothetical protein DL96DRAFT_1676459 [Flagelloscypha sp. PMI_526]|nr:hypothetical protein DL96DRAFT_1676459 [Flagelloscypha sp. PMI_526]
MAPTRSSKDVKAITALALDGPANSLDALSELHILQEAASRWAFDSERDLRGDDVHPKDMFDVIGGTGIGGFYAILFTRLNLTIGQVIQAHRILEERLFSTEVWMSKNQNACMDVLQTTLGEIEKELEVGISLDLALEEKGPFSKGFVCVVNASAGSNCRLLRSYRSRRSQGPPCTIRQALQATLSNHIQLPPVQIEEELFLSAQGMFTNPTRILMSELQNCFSKSSNVACVVSIGAGYSDAHPLVPGGILMENSQSSQILADEFTSQCHELGPFFFRLSLPSSLSRLPSLKDTYSQLKGATMAYLDSHSVTTMLDDLADALTEHPEVVPLERLGSLAGKDGQSQLMARIHKVQQHLDDSLFRDVNTWLQPIQQTSKLDANIRDRGETTCQWILENTTFKQWIKAKGGIFWYHGLMGTGKTMTMSFVTHRVLADPNIHVAYYYFEFTNPTTLSEEALLRSLFAQLAPAAPEVARVLHQQHNGGAHQPQLATLQTALRNLASDSVKPIFIFVDALDELPPAQRKYLLQYLLIFCNSPDAARTHVMVTSREDRDIHTAFENVDYQLGVQGDLVRQDIAAFVGQQLAAKKWSLWPSEEVEMMRHLLNERADGQYANSLTCLGLPFTPTHRFRMVACQVEILKTVKTSGKLFESLHSLPKTLGSTYEYILNQIPEDLRGAARMLFATLSFASWGISATELSALVAVDAEDAAGSNRLPVFQEANYFHDPRDLLDLGTSFVSQENYGEPYLRLVHASVKEYLLVDSGQWFTLRESSAHNLIAHGCLALLHHFKVPVQPGTRTPFTYSQYNWFNHVFPSAPPTLLRQQQALYSTFPWREPSSSGRGYEHKSLLSSAATYCLLDFLETNLVKSIWSDDTLGSALIAAAGSTRPTQLALQCCRLLLHNGARVDFCGDNENALEAAARCGHLEIVKFLLENGTDVNATGRVSRTALRAAVSARHLEISKFLLEKGANVNAMGEHNVTALQAAAYGGDLEMCKFLLEKGADINATGGEFGTTLHSALAWGGNLEMVKFFWEKGANINATGGEYGSALQAAAFHQDLEIVKFLIEKGADVNATGGEYGSALHAAVDVGNFEIVKCLLENGTDVNATGGMYGGALQVAAYSENLEIVEFLLKKGANVNACGGMFGTPLDSARSYPWDRKIERYLREYGAKTYEEQMGRTYIFKNE